MTISGVMVNGEITWRTKVSKLKTIVKITGLMCGGKMGDQGKRKLKKYWGLMCSHAFFGQFSSGKWRVVDLPEIWVFFWDFTLRFGKINEFLNNFCLILDKNHYIWLKIFIYFWKICRNFEFWVKNYWVSSFLSLSFSILQLEFLMNVQKMPGVAGKENKLKKI